MIKNYIPTRSILRKFLIGLCAWLVFATTPPAQAELINPASPDYMVTAAELDRLSANYNEKELDGKGAELYKYLQLGGDKAALSPEQIAAVEAYYDRYEKAPFFHLSNMWVLICAFLVFIMHLGFATVESGMCQRKNTVNILFKNVYIVLIGIVLYALWGFAAMYPGDAWAIKELFAFGKPISGGPADNASLTYGGIALCQTGWTDFIYQAMFAATAATIVSGAVAERVKLSSFMIYAALLVGFAYPITGGWKWGMGWLGDMSFIDFAGSSVVHAFGGFAALACVLILGPRKGKFTAAGIKPILPGNFPLATIGVFLLWFGWFGFNGGSVLSADPGSISYVIVTTSLGAACGGLAAIAASWGVLKKPDLSMALNGILAGLVGITAGANVLSILGACIAGAICGAVVVFSVLLFDKLKIDDPVGAISVHGVCGVLGTLMPGIGFLCLKGAAGSFLTQLIGTLSIGIFAFIFSFAVFFILKLIMGVRVSEEEEHEGLDVAEHGAPAYNE